MLTTVEEVLRAYGGGIGVDDFADQLKHALRNRVGPDPRALSGRDRQVLASIGVPEADIDEHAPTAGRPVVDAAADLVAATSALLTAAQVATRLGRSTVRIRGAIADRSLYGVKVGRSWLLPPWQLIDDGPLPHLRDIIAAVPEETSAVTMTRVMTEPNDELFLDGYPVSPRDWLIAGQSPIPVAQMIGQLYAW